MRILDAMNPDIELVPRMPRSRFLRHSPSPNGVGNDSTPGITSLTPSCDQCEAVSW